MDRRLLGDCCDKVKILSRLFMCARNVPVTSQNTTLASSTVLPDKLDNL